MGWSVRPRRPATSTGTLSAYTGTQSQAGSLSLSSSSTAFTSFDLLGFDYNNQPVMLAIDNLAFTLVPEPGTAGLFLLAMGLCSAATRGRTRAWMKG